MSKGSKRPNIERMRRTLRLEEAASERRESAAYLASLTPQHRAVHEQGRYCGECANAAVQKMARALAMAANGMSAR